MKTYAIFGKPIAHSLSPVMHDTAFKLLGIDARYISHESDDPDSVRDIIIRGRIMGASITIPLKVSMIDRLDDVSEDARRIGAVNTIIRDGDRIKGENTDWIGIRRALEDLVGDLEGKRFLVLGAGGTARAALWAVLKAGGEAVVVSRRREAAEELAEIFSCESRSTNELDDIEADCFINTTPLGMRGYEEGSPLDRELLTRFGWGFDVIYRPLETKLIREAREAGCTVSGGLSMFVYQGAEQFRLWTGREAPVDIMEKTARSILEDEGN